MKNSSCCQNNSKTGKDFAEVESFLKLINEPNRLKILCLLRYQEKCVCDIWKEIDLAQNLVSHHLRALKDFGLIDSRQEGRKVIYSTNKKIADKYIKLLNKFLTSNL